jgi:hypothetical protein
VWQPDGFQPTKIYSGDQSGFARLDLLNEINGVCTDA